MPLLDVSAALTDPMLMDVFQVVRRIQLVDANGRGKHQDQTISPVYGVVTTEDPSDHELAPNYTQGQKTISIITLFRLRDQTAKNLPDIVLWGGNEYQVQSCEDATNYGIGFVEAIAVCKDFEPKAPGAK